MMIMKILMVHIHFANLCKYPLTFPFYDMISINTTQLVNDSSDSMIIVLSVFKVCLKTLE